MSNQIINRVNLNKELYNIKTYGDKIDLTLDNITKYLSLFIDKYNKVLGRLDGLEEALELIKDSLDELDGGTTSSVVFAFKASDSKPTRPTDLTLTPQTWSSVMPETDKPIYQVMALRIGDELTTWSDGNVWTPPIRITGKDGANSNKLEIYYRTASNTAPSTPQFSVDSIINSANGLTSAGKVTTATYDAWYVERKGITSEYTREYASFSTLQDNGTWSSWSKPYLVAAYGSDGSNGYGVEYVYRLSNKKYADLRINENSSVSQELLQTYTDANGTHWNEPGFIPTDNKPFDGYKWSSEMYEVSKNNLYCYVSSRRMINYKGLQVWEGFSKPKCQYIYSVSDGGVVDVNIGIVLKTVYRKGTSATQVIEGAPLNSNGTFNGSYDFETKILTPPDGWSLTPDIDSLQENEYMFFSDKIFLMDNDDNLWSDPKMMFGKPETADNVQVTVYAKSSDGAEALWLNYCLNSNGEGLGTFDFDTSQVTFESPLNTVWYLNIDNVIDENHTPIYSSTKNFYTNDLTRPWSSPIRYILPGDIISSSASNSVSFGAAIYKAVIDNTVPSKPQFNIALNQQFDFNKGQLVENTVTAIEWQLTPDLAALLLANSKYIVYVSYNNYICDRDSDGNIKEDTIRETGWTDPIKYLNIDQILQDVEQEALNAANEAIQNANNDLTAATGALNAARVDINKAKEDIQNAKDFLGDGYTAFINGQGSNLTVLMAQLATKDELTGYVTTSTYEQTAASIKLQVSLEYAQENELLIRTAVGEITADYIRLQVTEVIGGDVVTTAQLDIKANEIKSLIASDINNSTSVIGQEIDKIRIAASNKAVTDLTNKITTGEITVKPGNILLVAATAGNTGTLKAVFDLSIKEEGSVAAITSTRIVLNGETIAAAIAAKELNIDNFTYLFNRTLATSRSDKAMAIFGSNPSGTTKFCLDGSGLLAGGLITWGNGVGTYNTSSNLGLSISGHVVARSGYIGNENAGWEIGTLTEGSSTYPALLGSSNNNSRIVLSTEFIESTTSGTLNWCLQKDGTGQIARGNIAWTLSGSNKCNLTIKGDTYIEAAYIGSGSNTNNLLWLGTQNGTAFISAFNDTSKNGLIITPDYFAAGAARREENSGYLVPNPTWGWLLNSDGSGLLGQGSITWNTSGDLNIEGDFTCATYLNSVPAWKLSNNGNAQIGGGMINFNYSTKVLSVTGNIIANLLTLGGTNGAEMNFTTYDSSQHGVATNGFSYIDSGEPILFGQYSGSYYCVPLLKMGSSSGVTYQLCEVITISNTSITAESLAGIITGTSNRTTLYRVKEGSLWVYKRNSIEGSNVTGTYVSYEKNSSPREVYQNGTSSHFSTAIYTGLNDQYKIRVFVINDGEVTKAYDTYIAKKVSISMIGSIAAGGAYLDYTVSTTWEYLNALGAGDSTTYFLYCTSTGSTLSNAGPQEVTGLLTSNSVDGLTLATAYKGNIGPIPVNSAPFNTASGGISGDSSSSGTSVELVTSLSTSGSSTKAYSCSAFNSLLYSASVVKTAQAANTINIDGVAYTIVICDSVPSTKDEHTIYLVKE